MTEIQHRGCEGCIHKITDTCSIPCHYPLYIKECPCMNCILKMMCSRICELRAALYFKLAESSRLNERLYNNGIKP